METIQAYFIGLGTELRKAVKWVGLATGDSYANPAIKYIYSDGESIVATTGHVVHCFKTREIKPGLYTPLELEDYRIILVPTDEPDLKFPPWKTCLPDKAVAVTHEITLPATVHDAWNTAAAAIGSVAGIDVDLDYLKNIYSAKDRWKIYITGQHTQVLFEAENKLAVLMPRKVGWTVKELKPTS